MAMAGGWQDGVWHFERCRFGNLGLRTPERGQLGAAKENSLLLSLPLCSIRNSHDFPIIFPEVVDCFVRKGRFFCKIPTFSLSSKD